MQDITIFLTFKTNKMDTIGEAREHLKAVETLLEEIETKSEKIDLEVSRQRTRIFKLWCYVIFGHIYSPKGECKRCGHKKP